MVDARIGPGLKSMSKCKKRKEEQEQNGSTKFSGQSSTNTQNIRNNERFRKICKKNKLQRNLIRTNQRLCDENSAPTSPSSNSDSDRMSDVTVDIDSKLVIFQSHTPHRRIQRKSSNPQKNRRHIRSISMIDSNFWTCVKTCCGIVYENKDCAAVLIDVEQYNVNSCNEHDKKNNLLICLKEELPSVMIKSLPPKKQHIHRQNMVDPSLNNAAHEQIMPIDYSIPNVSDKKTSHLIASYPQHFDNISNNFLNKTKLNTNKVFKKSITRLLPKKLIAELSAAKNLIELCTDNRIFNNALSNECGLKYASYNENKNLTNTVNTEPIILNRYNDNSSDSGYDENVLDRPQNLIIDNTAQSVIKTTQVNRNSHFFFLFLFIQLYHNYFLII